MRDKGVFKVFLSIILDPLASACVSTEDLENSFLDGHHTLVLDLQGLLHERNPRFTWQSCQTLLEASKTRSEEALVKVVGKTTSLIDATKLEESEFNLFKQKMEYDFGLMDIYLAKKATHQSLVYHHKLEHLRRRCMQAREAADTLFARQTPTFSFNVAGRSVAQEVSGLENFCRDVRKAENILPESPLMVLTIVNWAAPSTITAAEMSQQESIMGATLNMEGIDGLAVVFTPVWDRKKGMLYKAETMVLDRIANANVNCDERATLSFEERPDSRDRRPLEYPMRLCFASAERLDSGWRKVPLVRDNRLSTRARMVHSKDLLIVESMSDDVPPELSSVQWEVNAADKYSQLGDSATATILDHTARALKMPMTTALVIVDCGPRTGDWARSVLRMLPSMNLKTYYYALGSSDEVEWAAHSTKQLAEELILNGMLTIPGYVPLPLEIAAELQAKIPDPLLQSCGLQEDGALTEPAEFHKWSKVKTFEEEFQKLQTRFDTLKTASMVEQSATPQKRRRLCPGLAPSVGSSSDPPPQAAPCHQTSVDIEMLEAGTIKDVPLTGSLKGLELRISAGHKIF